MSSFRCFFLDEDGHIASVIIVEGGTDSDAVEQARRLLAERASFCGIELWDGIRRVHHERRY